ncbi:type I site-specific deoxyribonuclease [Salinisphaera shabanensis T35B1]
MQETEADTRANRIDPVLRDAGWGVVDGSRVAREEIAKGRITTAGRINPLKADYVLSLNGRKLAVIEAKRAGLGYTEGLAQRLATAPRVTLF